MTSPTTLVEKAKAIVIDGCGCDRACEQIGPDVCGCARDAASIIALVIEEAAKVADNEAARVRSLKDGGTTMLARAGDVRVEWEAEYFDELAARIRSIGSKP